MTSMVFTPQARRNYAFSKPSFPFRPLILNDSFAGKNMQKQSFGLANIWEQNDGFIIELAISGYNKENVSIQLENQTLTISGDKKVDNGIVYQRREINTGGFSRTFELPKEIIAESIVAEFDNGILKISIPKSPKIQPKDIVVK